MAKDFREELTHQVLITRSLSRSSPPVLCESAGSVQVKALKELVSNQLCKSRRNAPVVWFLRFCSPVFEVSDCFVSIDLNRHDLE